MNTRRFVLREAGMLAFGELLCAGATVGIFAMAGYYNTQVLLGAIVGGVLAVGNFFLMAVAAEAAADRAVNEDVKGGKDLLKASQRIRLLVLFGLILLLAKTGVCNPIAMAVPVLAASPVLMVVEFFRKAGEDRK